MIVDANERPSTEMPIPDRLEELHAGEEILRQKALNLVTDDDRLTLHLAMVEHTMDICDLLRQFEADDEDLKVVQVFGMRIFSAFGAALKLTLSGYHQNSALILRDVLETVFLLDLFRTDRGTITRWRLADKKGRLTHFKLVKVREALDKRDGNSGKKRAELYELFSELAGHPTMLSAEMLRPTKGGDAVIGPFIEKTSLEAVLGEMGRLAIQVGQHLLAFYQVGWDRADPVRDAFNVVSARWIETFYGEWMRRQGGGGDSRNPGS